MELELSFAQQSTAFFWSLAMGAALGVLYSAFKLLRVIFTPGRATVFLLDVLFMLACTLAVFLFSLGFLGGYIRLYVLLGALVGLLAYRFTLGRLCGMICLPVIAFVRAAGKKIFRVFKIFAKKLLKTVRKVLYNVNGKKVCFTKELNKGKSNGTVEYKAENKKGSAG